MITRRHALMGAAGLLAAPAMVRRAATQDVPPPGKRPWAAQVPTLRIGLLGGENDSDRLGRYDAYGKLLGGPAKWRPWQPWAARCWPCRCASPQRPT